jgi:hypothetical protein
MELSHWGEVTLESLFINMLIIVGVELSLVNHVVFRTNKEVISLILWEVHAMHIDHWVQLFTTLVSYWSCKVKVQLRLIKHVHRPETQTTVITYCNYVVCFL